MKRFFRAFKYWARHQQRWFGKWHLYLGIIAGGIIAIIGITGSILTFRDEIDAALNPTLFKAISNQPKLSLSEAYTLFHQAHPHININYIYQQKDNPNATYLLYNFATKKQYFVNPYNGQSAGSRVYESGFINTIMNIHTSLLIPKVGNYIVGIASLILLILTISGLRLWIPKKWKYLKEVLTVKKGASGKRQNYDWHNILGFYSAPIVAVLSLTGFCISFYLPMVAILFSLSGKNPKIAAEIYGMKSKIEKNMPALSLDKILIKSQEQIPNSQIVGIAFPADSLGTYRLDIIKKGVAKSGQRELLVVDQYSGKTLATSQRFPNVAQGFLSWMSPLHYGTFGGMTTRILALIGGLIPAALFITGFVIWWPRWKKQRQNLQKDSQKINNKSRAIKISSFTHQLKSGFKYAFWLAFLSLICGGIYGMLSGIVIAPAAYVLIFTVPIVLVNFIIALVTNILHLIISLPFKKKIKSFYRYFAYSLAFMVVYGILYVLLMNTGLHIF